MPAERKSKRRGPGRPANNASVPISTDRILDAGLAICRREPLQDVSIVRMAREFHVTPALVHYYLGGRNALTSGVMNRFYRDLVVRLPSHTGDWRADAREMALTIYREYVLFPGIVAYVISHNRYRLFQDVKEGDTDYGVLFFERYASCIRQAGLDAARTATFMHLLLQHVLTSAHQKASHQLPGDHQAFLVSRLRSLDLNERPNVKFVLESFSSLDAEQAFEAGLNLLIQGIETARDSSSLALQRRRRRSTGISE